MKAYYLFIFCLLQLSAKCQSSIPQRYFDFKYIPDECIVSTPQTKVFDIDVDSLFKLKKGLIYKNDSNICLYFVRCMPDTLSDYRTDSLYAILPVVDNCIKIIYHNIYAGTSLFFNNIFELEYTIPNSKIYKSFTVSKRMIVSVFDSSNSNLGVMYIDPIAVRNDQNNFNESKVKFTYQCNNSSRQSHFFYCTELLLGSTLSGFIDSMHNLERDFLSILLEQCE